MLPAGLSKQKVQIVCTVTGTGAASLTATLFGNCISGVVGNATTSYTLLSYDTVGTVAQVNTEDTAETLDLALQFGGSSPTATNNVTLISVIPEFIQ